MDTPTTRKSSSSIIPLMCCAMILLFLFGGAGSHHRGGGSSSGIPIYDSRHEQPDADPAQVAKIIAANKALVVKMKEAGWKTLVSENRDDPNDPYVIMGIEKKESSAIWPTISMVEEPQITTILNEAKESMTKMYSRVSGEMMIRDGRIHYIHITFLPEDTNITHPSRLAYTRSTVSGDMDEYAEVMKLGKWSKVTRVEDKTLIHTIGFRGKDPNTNDIAEINIVSNEKAVLDAFGTM